MTRIVALLEEHGYVTRTPDPVDRRQVVVAASQAGLDLLTAERRRKDRWISQRFGTLTTDERAALAAALPVLEKLSRS
jgi:DNA-binding MarR family transcriptional regulator